ncbi:MAG: A/G-specific adenine glycosylase [Flavobacteriaceae bacterium]|nr:A/G-specific adenine glycosylase [Flavobacteriaceae bacterium]
MSEKLEFSNILILWYLKNKRDLPWRKTKDPYLIWLSEIILQQTKVLQGTPYYLKFVENFDDISLLAKADEKQILNLWQGLGYYSRARNLHKTAIHITNNLNGVFPNNYEDLKKLKGVGDYTASAIASFCFNLPEATVDGNVYRVFSRYFGITTPINSTKGIKEFKQLAQILINPNKPGTHNQSIMEFGALLCKPKNPDCFNCPLNNSCFALQNKQIKKLPVKTNKIKIKKRYFNFIVINNNNQSTCIQQRVANDIWKNLYQFPLFESNNEIDVDYIIKSSVFQDLLKKESYKISKYNQKQILHKLTHQHLYTTFWVIDVNTDLEKAVNWQNLSNFALPTLIQNFVDDFKKGD